MQAESQGDDARRLDWRRLLTQWWTDEVIDTVDHRAVIEKRREECRLTARYLFMTAMSAAIAVLGLLLSSPAVVIGAMLLSPLMDPIIGAGFALAIGDYRWLLKAARALLWGSLLAIALCALIVMLSPLQTITSEIAARTRPNLFDLMVALFSAMAGAYATIRGQAGTIVGVAIATALMPPLAVIGFGLATFNWTVFSGSLLLYITNLMAIAITAALMARLYGFRTRLSEEHSRLQNIAMVAAFVALAVPLALSLRQIAWESNSTALIRKTIEGGFDSRARLSDLVIDWDSRPIRIEASVLTAEPREDAEALFTRLIAGQLGAPVDLDLTQIEIGTNRRAAEQAQIAAARTREEQARKAQIEALATRLSALTGGDRNRVVVEAERSRALVQATPIEGIDLAGWRALESRLAVGEPGWTIEIVPPAEPLPEIEIAAEGPSEAGMKAIETIAWAAARRGQPVELAGPREQTQAVAALLRERGVTVRTEEARGPLRARWAQD